MGRTPNASPNRRSPKAARALRAMAMALTLTASLSGCAGNLGAGSFADEGEPVDSALGHYLAARHARVARDTDAAAHFYELALNEDPENHQLIRRTFLVSLSKGDHARAFKLAEQLVDDGRGAGLARLVLATRDARADCYVEAEKFLIDQRAKGFAALLRPLMLAWMKVGLGDIAAAEQALKPLERRDSFRSFRDYHLALMRDVAGDAEGAADVLAQVDEEQGLTSSATLARGAILAKLGDSAGARKVFEDFLERIPNHPPIRRALAMLDDGDRPRSTATTVREGLAEAFFGAATALAQDRGRDAARMYANLALFLRPGFDDARILLGEILETDRRWEEAIEAFAVIEPGSPYYRDSRLRIAFNLERLDRLDEAVAALQAIVADDARDNSAVIALADLLRARERYVDAAKAYDLALIGLEHPEKRHWSLFYARGIALERTKKWARAEADFLKALELSPDHPLVLNYLGYSWVEQGLHLDRAQEMIEKAVSQRPNDGYIVDSLGWVLYRRGKYGDAVKHLERAAELRPNDPVINDHLGDAYWRVGRRLEARFQWSHALALKPEEDQVTIIRNKLERGLRRAEAGNDG